MQPQQSCPRCHSTEFKTKEISLLLVSNPDRQGSISRNPNYVNDEIVKGVLNIISTLLFLGFLLPISLNNPGFFTNRIADPFIIYLCGFLVVFADASFLFSFLPQVLLAPTLKGSGYTCRNCKFVWYDWPPEPAQTFEHIAYSKTKYNQCNLIEGVVCPNPECGSLNVVSNYYWKVLSRDLFYKVFIRTKKLRQSLYGLILLSGLQIVLSFQLHLNTFPFYVFWLFLLLFGMSRVHYYWVDRTGRYFEGRYYACPECKTNWFINQTNQKVAPSHIKWYEQEVAFDRVKGSSTTLANNILNLAYYRYEYQRKVEEALALYQEGLAIAQSLDSKPLLAVYYHHIASLLIEEGQTEQSLLMAEQSVALYTELKKWHSYAGALDTLALAFLRTNQLEKALPRLKEVIIVTKKTEGYRPRSLFWGIQGLAEAALQQGQPMMAARLYAAVQAQRDGTGEILSPLNQTKFDKLVNDVRNQLDSFSFVAAWREGSQLTLDQAIEYACSLTAAPLG